ncbi:MAG: FxLYD domain-containing protein [Nitrososphaeraceae archaeon]|nr:FxLYD domain-containing protein [Nitrososphaeraceae archaeon]MDW0166253.1 FxLYD domain-containing protein [Nitrososphaeraceae archaeon]
MKDYFRNFFCSFSFLLIPITVLLFCSTILLIINGTGYSIDNFSVLERNIVIDQSGFIHLLGEIRNTSNETQRSITANANFYDKNGQNIGNGSGIVSLRSLNTGQVSPFEIIFLDKNQTKHFFNYTLNFTSEIGQQKPDSIVITSLKSRPDIFGYYYVSGRISNMGNDTATNVLAIASFFDSNGKIIGLSSAITEPSNMTSHSTASFTVVMDDKLQSPKIKNYSLTVDSDQYASK